MDKRLIGLTGGVLATALFLAVNVIGNRALGSVRIDLTEEDLFTLSQGAKNIADDLEEPIRLYLYYSEEVGREIDGAKEYHGRVLDVLEEFVRHSDGNLVLETIDPEPYSEAEDRAVAEGIAAIPTSPPFYFGLVGTNPTDDREVIPFFGTIAGGGIDFASKERFLEYDLSRLIHSLAHPVKPRIGVLSTLPIEGGMGNPVLNQGRQPRWEFLGQLERFLDVEVLSPADEELPDGLDALLVVHPRELSQTLQYAIDQFVMRGGKLVALVDPHCEADMSGTDPSNPMASMGAPKDSSLNELFRAWGFEMVPSVVAGDLRNALPVRGRGNAPVDYVVWMDLEGERLSEEDPVTSLLQSLRLIAPGVLRPTDGATTTFEPLVTTSEDSMEIDVSRLMFLPDPQGLLESFVSGKTHLTLAARVSGEASSAFPDGPPAGGEEPAGTNGHQEEEQEGEQGAEDAEDAGETPDHLAASEGPIQVIAIADADMLHDSWWLQRNTAFGLDFGATKVSDNLDLVLNALENLTGGEDLVSIRARGRYSRPFEKVEEMRRAAQREFLSKEKELRDREAEMERRIAELQKDKDPSDPDSFLFLSPAQRETYEELLAERRETRKQLREVQHSMNEDIERLGRKVKFVNVLALPILVTILALGLGLWRVQRRGTR